MRAESVRHVLGLNQLAGVATLLEVVCLPAVRLASLMGLCLAILRLRVLSRRLRL